VLASSTSAIPGARFTEGLEGRARCLVVHPINPPHLVPCVELVPTPWTAEATIDRTEAIMRAIGQSPIRLTREIEAFVVNRLQIALLEEAFRLVDQGICDADAVDVAIKDGLALRWSFMGPFETIDLNAPAGVRDYVERYKGIGETLFPTMQWKADWAGPVLERIEAERREHLSATDLGERARWRDRRLMALLKHKRQAANDLGD
jgi:L-gulonate 3-dehydrogenase